MLPLVTPDTETMAIGEELEGCCAANVISDQITLQCLHGGSHTGGYI
jgi:hypothetical protein